MTKLTWDNAILIGPKMAERLQIKVEDVVELSVPGNGVNGKKSPARSGFKPAIPTTQSR